MVKVESVQFDALSVTRPSHVSTRNAHFSQRKSCIAFINYLDPRQGQSFFHLQFSSVINLFKITANWFFAFNDLLVVVLCEM